jgi:hypothetical protein
MQDMIPKMQYDILIKTPIVIFPRDDGFHPPEFGEEGEHALDRLGAEREPQRAGA